MTVTPLCIGSVEDQIYESIDTFDSILEDHAPGSEIISQTVFLRNAIDQSCCDRLFAEHYGNSIPVTTYVYQPPCNGSAVALEAWCAGGESVRITRPKSQVAVVSHDGLSWIHCSHTPKQSSTAIYESALYSLVEMNKLLAVPSASFDQVIRLWLYLSDITGSADNVDRYMELNRARTNFYQNIVFGRKLKAAPHNQTIYPASTGIGMAGSSALAMSLIALNTDRQDVFLVPIENPSQTPAYHYPPAYSPESPKFVRALALVVGNDVVTWVSGTASILKSESQHIGDIRKQTEQAIDNITRLIATSNYKAHGLSGATANLARIAQMRVYVKRPQDYEICRNICTQRLGQVPILYVTADVCRSNLLVEMEGVMFSQLQGEPSKSP